MENFQAILTSLEMGLPILLTHLLLTIAIWLITLVISFWITPYHELREIRAGNVSVAISAGGAALGAAIPLAFCLAGAVNGWDIAIWAIPVMLIQLSAFWLTQLLIPDLSNRLDAGDLAAAIFLLLFRIGFGCINAAAIAA
jgi:putative membrane protein